mgnify:CR=1 FL=1
MKNVIVYNQIDTKYHGGNRYVDEHLTNYLNCQIDNSLRLGWDKNDIILGTNFDFEYKGIKNYELEDVCTYSGFNNFWYGTLELMNKGILTDDFWLHDQDTWAVKNFEFPEFDGEVGGCEYVATHQWNCGSIYFKKSSKFILEYIVEVMRSNEKHKVSSDEEWIAYLRHAPESEIKGYLTSIDNRYNVGVTHFKHRYDRATKPICVLAFKPDEKSNFDVVKDFVDIDLLNIFKKHNLFYEQLGDN